jgi:diguanylate cyclase (GGDEF)-like protein
VNAADGSYRNGRIAEALRLARDLCAGSGAFFVTKQGEVRLSLSSMANTPEFAERTLTLGRLCLEHPGAAGPEVFYTAEPMEKRSLDVSLTCVAATVMTEKGTIGVLGVVDNWLPELDDQEFAGLQRIAADLGRDLESIAALASELPDAPTPISEPTPLRPPPTPRTGPTPRETASSAEVATLRPVPIPDAKAAAHPDTFLGTLAQLIPDGVLVVREDGAIVFANETMIALVGRPAEDILGTDVTALLSDLDGSAPSGARGQSHEGSRFGGDSLVELLAAPPPGRRLLLRSADSNGVTVDVSGAFVGGSMDSTEGRFYVSTFRDSGPEISSENDPSALADALIESIDDAVVLTDVTGTVVGANARAVEWLAPESGSGIIGEHGASIVRLVSSQGSSPSLQEHPLSIALQGLAVSGEHWMLDRSDHEPRQVSVSTRLLPAGVGGGAILFLRDITAEAEQEARLTRLAMYDSLTGLANRNLLQEHLERALRNHRDHGERVVMVLLDLDDFKSVNDQYGHGVGDAVLVTVAGRIQHAVRSTEVASRIGGDEFVIVYTGAASDELDLIQERIRKALLAPYRVGSLVINVGASIGSVIANRFLDSPDSLLARADAEMYRRKQSRTKVHG